MLILLFIAIAWGRRFAERIVLPIRVLVKAAEKVKNGDLTAQVPIDGLQKDEIKILSSAFNRMVDQLDRQQQDLVVAQRALAWSDVARKVAHEIKNPLTPIQLSTDMLIKKFADEVKDKEAFLKYTNNILKHSSDIKSIVSEFVDFARLPSSSFSKCEIVSMMHDLVESRKLINNSITYKFSSNLQMFDFVCDIAQMNRAIVNLLLNAEEALTEENREDKRIDVELYIMQEEVRVSVSDNGPGFSKELLEQARESYVTTKLEGAGLGLAIVDRIIMDHFGEMHISNNKQGGGKVELIFNYSVLKSRLK